MLQKRTFCHFRGADTANQQSDISKVVIKGMKARAACRQKESKHVGHCAA
jgi:hypothetical protein